MARAIGGRWGRYHGPLDGSGRRRRGPAEGLFESTLAFGEYEQKYRELRSKHVETNIRSALDAMEGEAGFDGRFLPTYSFDIERVPDAPHSGHSTLDRLDSELANSVAHSRQ